MAQKRIRSDYAETADIRPACPSCQDFLRILGHGLLSGRSHSTDREVGLLGAVDSGEAEQLGGIVA